MTQYHFSVSAGYNNYRRDVGSDRNLSPHPVTAESSLTSNSQTNGVYALNIFDGFMYVKRGGINTIQAYNIKTGARDTTKDFVLPSAAGNARGFVIIPAAVINSVLGANEDYIVYANGTSALNVYRRGGGKITSNLLPILAVNAYAIVRTPTHYYTLNYGARDIIAYTIGANGLSANRASGDDINIASDAADCLDMFYDDGFIYLANERGLSSGVAVYNVATKARDTSKEFNYANLTGFTTVGNPNVARPNGICMNENTIWIGDQNSGGLNTAVGGGRRNKIFAFARKGVKQGLFVPTNNASAGSHSLGVDVSASQTITYTEIARANDTSADYRTAGEADYTNFGGASICFNRNPLNNVADPFPLNASTTYRLRYVQGGSATQASAQIIGTPTQAHIDTSPGGGIWCGRFGTVADMTAAFGNPVSNPNSPPSFNGGQWILEEQTTATAANEVTGLNWRPRNNLPAKKYLGWDTDKTNGAGWDWLPKTT